jgi:hypothetical protein
MYATGEDGLLVHSRFVADADEGPLFGVQVRVCVFACLRVCVFACLRVCVFVLSMG